MLQQETSATDKWPGMGEEADKQSTVEDKKGDRCCICYHVSSNPYTFQGEATNSVLESGKALNF